MVADFQVQVRRLLFHGAAKKIVDAQGHIEVLSPQFSVGSKLGDTLSLQTAQRPIAKVALHYGAGKNVVKAGCGLVTLRGGGGGGGSGIRGRNQDYLFSGWFIFG